MNQRENPTAPKFGKDKEHNMNPDSNALIASQSGSCIPSDSSAQSEVLSTPNSHPPSSYQTFALVTMTILWIFITSLRIWTTLDYQKQNPPSAVDEAGALTKSLYLNFGYKKYNEVFQKIVEEMNRAVEKHYDNMKDKKPGDNKLAIQYVILKDALYPEDKEIALKRYKEIRSQLKGADELALIMETVYFPEEFDKKAPVDKDVLESNIKKNLSGWFRDYTLYRLYKMTNNKAGIENILSRAQTITNQLIQGYAIILLLILAFIVGLFLLFLFPFISFFVYPNMSLEAKGIREQENPNFAPMLLWKAWFVFLVWEFARFFISQFFGLYFKQYKNIPIPIIFIFYMLLYAFSMFVIFKVFGCKKDKLPLTSIGINPKNAWRRIGEILIGVGGYCVALPLVIAGALISAKILGTSPRSQNVAFDILSNASSRFDILLLFIMIGIIAPIFEEILFRGVLYTSIRRKLPAFFAILFISLLFALIHFDFGMLAGLTVIGIVLATLYERTSSLVPSIVTHILWNSVTFAIYITLLK